MTTLIQKVSESLHKNKLTLVTAESCTGGWVAKQITDLAGSSAIFDRGFVTYSNQAKMDMLNVQASTLKAHGAVSEAVVIEMTQGALLNSLADIAVSISGIAGPVGGSEDKPVGTVCFAWQHKGQQAIVETRIFDGDRDSIRVQAVDFCLNGMAKIINSQ